MYKLSEEEMLFLEENKYYNNLKKYFLTTNEQKEYLERARKLPFSEIENLIIKNNLKGLSDNIALITFIRNYYNVSLYDAANRVIEVKKILKYQEKLKKLQLKNPNSF